MIGETDTVELAAGESRLTLAPNVGGGVARSQRQRQRASAA